MIKLSVVIITYNEEKNIERCILSVKDIADEIVVLDSFSTDKTEEICKKQNIKFHQHKFDGHIEQKNRAITFAKNNHILSLDADEALSNKLKKSISEVKTNWTHDGYYFNRLTNFCGKWIKYGGWYPDKKLRLFDRRKGYWGGNNPHDKYILKKNSLRKYLKGDLLHYAFNSIVEHLEQIEKFSSIKAKVAKQKGKKANHFKLLINPAFKFLKMYIIKLGFLDGYYGYIIAKNSAKSTKLKYYKLRQLNKNE